MGCLSEKHDIPETIFTSGKDFKSWMRKMRKKRCPDCGDPVKGKPLFEHQEHKQRNREVRIFACSCYEFRGSFWRAAIEWDRLKLKKPFFLQNVNKSSPSFGCQKL